jgi:hypothetical protein
VFTVDDDGKIQNIRIAEHLPIEKNRNQS